MRNTKNLTNTHIDTQYTQSRKVDALHLGSNDQCYVAIPYVHFSFFRNHVTLFVLEKETKTLTFYDPKGYSIADYNDPRMKKLAEDLLRKHKLKLTQNTTREQVDFFNCGMYVINRIRLLNNKKTDKSFIDALQENPLTYHEVMEMRKSSVHGVIQ